MGHRSPRETEKSVGGSEATIQPRKPRGRESIRESEGDDTGDIVGRQRMTMTKDDQERGGRERGILDNSIQSSKQIFFKLVK